MKNELKEEFKKKWLQEKIVVLKPSPRGGKMVSLEQKSHINFFMAEGATETFPIFLDRKGDRIEIFTSDEERAFFEKKLGKVLNVHDDEGYLATFSVKITKDAHVMENGVEFNLADVKDNLRYRVLRTSNTISPSWEERYEREYKWAFVDKEDVNKKEVEQSTQNEKAYMAFGELKTSEEKLKKFLQVYWADKKSAKKIGSDSDKDWMIAEVHKLIKEDISGFLETYENDFYSSKVFLLKALEAGGIEKTGVNEYVIIGDEETYQFEDLARKISYLETDQDDIYLKLVSQINAV
jgi:hypothetical protein